MSGWVSQIADAIVASIETVTIANGYSQDIKTVSFDEIKLNLNDYKDYQLPAVQIYDQTGLYNMERSRSKSQMFIAVEICLRTTERLGTVNQKTLWNLREDVVRSIMKDPRLGLNFVVNCIPIDRATDLHMQEPNYTATVGFMIEYYEPITRDNC